MKFKGIMLVTFVLLAIMTISAVNAADNIISDNLTVSDDGDVLDASSCEKLGVNNEEEYILSNSSFTVTESNFNDYFNKSGSLLNVSGELTFEGDFSSTDLNLTNIYIDKPITLKGNYTPFDGITFVIQSDNVTIEGFSIFQNKTGSAITIESGSNVNIINNYISYSDESHEDSYAVFANMTKNLRLINNIILYRGETNGSWINKGILISNSSGTIIEGNKMNLTLVSVKPDWKEISATSSNASSIWFEDAYSEGIFVNQSENVTFRDNVVNLFGSSSTGDYDIINTVKVYESNSVTINRNNISAFGYTYIYGIKISKSNFTISENKITVKSYNNYAAGISIDGLAEGLVKNNVIDVTGVNSTYAVYSDNFYGDVLVDFSGNNITGYAYSVFGLELFDVVSIVTNNTIDLKGNYTTGIAYRGNSINVVENIILLNSSDEGNKTILDFFGVETVGIKIVQGNSTISQNKIYSNKKGISITANNPILSNNTIYGWVSVEGNGSIIEDNYINTTTNNYAVDLNSSSNNVANNVLYAKTLKGELAVKSSNDTNVIYGNSPSNYTYADVQALLDLASPGETINLVAGIYDIDNYSFNVTIKNLTIEGSNGTVFNINGETQSSATFVLLADNITISGIKFNNTDGAKSYGQTAYGSVISINSYNNITIYNCEFLNFLKGIDGKNLDGAEISRCYFTGFATIVSPESGVSENGCTAITLKSSNKTIIANNTFEGQMLDSINISGSSYNNYILENIFIENTHSIYIDGAAEGSLIQYNVFDDCGYCNNEYSEILYKNIPVITIKNSSDGLVVSNNIFNALSDSILIKFYAGNETHGLNSTIGSINITENTVNDPTNVSGDDLNITLVYILVYYNEFEFTAPIQIIDNTYNAPNVYGDFSASFLNAAYEDSEGNITENVFEDDWACANGYVITHFSNLAPEMIVTVSNIAYGDDLDVLIATNFGSGNITVQIGDNNYTVGIINDTGNLRIAAVNPGNYSLIATFLGNEHYSSITTRTEFSVILGDTFKDLQALINNTAKNGILELNKDFVNNGSIDNKGIVISKAMTINGNGHTLDAKSLSRIFYITYGNVTLKNITFKNGCNDDSGGGVLLNSESTVVNSTFINCSVTSSAQGGGIYGGNAYNCSFINCSAAYQGGGMAGYGTDAYNCSFINCSAISRGGGMSGENAYNCSFINCISRHVGGGFHGGDAYNCIFTHCYASDGGGGISDGDAHNCSFYNCTADGFGGGGIRYGEAHDCYFENCSSNDGGAIHVDMSSNIYNSIFINCYSTVAGGAIHTYSEYINVTNCSFMNCYSDNGGAIYIENSANNVIIDSNFTNCTANNGGAVYIIPSSDNITIGNCRFTDCYVSEYGGSVYWNADNGLISNSVFTNSTAKRDGGAIYWVGGNGTIEYSNFTKSQAKNGGAVYVDENLTVTIIESKFEDNAAEELGGAVYGGNVSDCNVTGNSDPQIFNSSLIKLNTTIIIETNVTDLKYGDTISISIRLRDQNDNEVNSAIVDIVLIKDNKMVSNATSDISNGTAYYEFDDLEAGTYDINVTFNGDDDYLPSNSSITFTVNKIDSTLTVDNVEIDYGDSVNVNVTAEGAKGITAMIDNEDVNVTDYTVLISGLNAGDHTLTVTTIADENHNNVTKTVNITVNKIDSTLSVDNIVFDYNSTGSSDVSYDGATAVIASVVGHPEAVVNVKNDTITVSGLDVGTYNLTVTTVADENHNNVTITANITVNKIDSTLTVDNVVLDYAESVNVTVTAEGAEGITAKINSDNVAVNEFTIPVSGLNAGAYNLTVTTVTDSNHNPVNKTVTITVNKVNSTLTVDNVVLDYGKTTNVTAITEGATGVTAKIDNDDAVVNGNTITIPSLDVGNYTLTVTTVADENHNNVTKTANITVNKVKSVISIETVDVDAGSDLVVNASLSDNASGSVNFILSKDGAVISNVTSAIVNSVASYRFTDLGAGSYKVNATYSGDDVYLASENTSSFVVGKLESVIVVDVADVDVGSILVVNASLSDNASGSVNFILIKDNAVISNISSEISNAIAHCDLSDLEAGTYNLTVTYAGDNVYLPSNTTASFTVNKVKSVISIETANVDAGSDLVVNASLSDNASGSVNFILIKDGVVISNVTSAIVNSVASYRFADLGAGSYKVNATYSGDDVYLASENTSSFVVGKLESVIVVDVADVDVGSILVVNASLSDNASGSVNFILIKDGAVISNVSSQISNAAAHCELSDLKAGNYNINITYIGDGTYLPSNTTASFTVNKVKSVISIETADVDAGSDLVVNASLSDNASGSVSFILSKDGAVISNVTSSIVNSAASYRFTNLGAGSYNIKATYGGDDVYLASENTASFVAGKLHPSISIDVHDINVGEDLTVTVNLPADATGIVNFIITNGSGVNASVNNGVAYYKFSNLQAGQYNVSGIYSGDGGYYSAKISSIINVVKFSPDLSSNALDIDFDETETVSIALPGDATGTVNYEVLKANQLVDSGELQLSGEQLNLRFDNMTIGVYTVNVRYSGDSRYNAISSSNKFIVRPKVTIAQNVTVGEDVRVYIDFGVDVSDIITVKVDGRTSAVFDIENGITNDTLSTAKLTTLDHNVTFSYEGKLFDKEVFNYVNGSSKEYAMKLAPIVVEVPDALKSDDDGIVVVYFEENVTGTLEVFVDNLRVQIVEIIDGIAEIDLSNYKNGNYNITFKFTGDEIYASFEKDLTVTVTVTVSKITASNANVLYSSNGKYSVKVYDGDGNLASGIKVTFLINSKSYKTATTNSKGVASVVISKVPGTYKITAKAHNVAVTKTLTVKHLVALKSVTVKKSAKKLVLTATLSKVNKKYLKNKKITFKFNGKKYTAKTNKKGVAKVTVKSSVLKKLKVGKKITYQATYLKDTVKKTVKVKK